MGRNTEIIHIGTQPVSIRKSARATRMRIAVYCDGTVTAVQPSRISLDRFVHMLEQKAAWIEEKLGFYRAKGFVERPQKLSVTEEKRLRIIAKEVATERAAYFNAYYKLEYKKIFIKNQKTRWGSCSSKQNLNFNFRIALLRPELQDYLVVHELCHLKEMNHGKAFWALIEEQIPEYRELDRELKRQSIT